MLVLVVLGFVVCLGVPQLYDLMQSFGFENQVAIVLLSFILELSSSVINPIIYGFYSAEFKQGLKCWRWTLVLRRRSDLVVNTLKYWEWDRQEYSATLYTSVSMGNGDLSGSREIAVSCHENSEYRLATVFALDCYVSGGTYLFVFVCFFLFHISWCKT